MTLIYASTFNDALGKLTHAEQKQVKLTAFDIMLDPKGSGLSLERLNRTADDKLWSARVSRDLRIILRREGDDNVLAYVGHHDDAYSWAERRKIVRHERTGAMQIVQVVQRKEEQRVFEEPVRGQGSTREKVEPFWALTDDQMLDVGVPRDWLQPVREMSMSELDDIYDVLPAEAAEALYDFATGGRLEDHAPSRTNAGSYPMARVSESFDSLSESALRPRRRWSRRVIAHEISEPDGTDPAYLHPDAQRRFRVIEDIDALRAAMDAPFEKWAVFLHPAQAALVEKRVSGPTRVTGSAGTGKTIVALHRAVHLARTEPTSRVLLTTFSQGLADALQIKCDLLTGNSPGLQERIDVRPIDAAARELYARHFGEPRLATSYEVKELVRSAMADGHGEGLSEAFLIEEWEELVDAWGVTDEESYAQLPRIGRRTRLGQKQREAAWRVFEFIRKGLTERHGVTWSMIYQRLTRLLQDGETLPWDHVVVDEAQDLSVAQVRFLAEAGEARTDSLFLAGDIGQRIFRLPFSWARLGLDIRGRSHSLKVNYRTSHQIRAMADRLLPAAITDMDGIEEGRRGTISIFDGPEPEIEIVPGIEEERDAVSAWIEDCISCGISEKEIGILVRGPEQLERARAVRDLAGVEDVRLATMHEAKGLEFRAVVVMACDEDVLPDPDRLEGIGDIGELETAYETERHLLYVACTRARDRLLVTGIEPGSEFLDDLEA